MTLEEIKQKDINKGDIFKNTINGRKMIITGIERTNIPTNGHCRVFVKEHAPGELSLVLNVYDVAEAFGQKISAGNATDEQSASNGKTSGSEREVNEEYSHNQYAKEQLEDLPEDEADQYLKEMTSEESVSSKEEDTFRDPADDELDDLAHNQLANSLHEPDQAKGKTTQKPGSNH